MKTKSVIGLILVIVIIVAIWLVGIPMKETTRYIGFDQQARQNPYLAAQKFINRTAKLDDNDQQYIEIQQGLALVNDLPSVDDTIIIASPRSTLSNRQNNQLQQWVENGGHLIVFAKNYFDPTIQSNEDPLLDNAGIEFHQFESRAPQSLTPLGGDKPSHNLWSSQATTINGTYMPKKEFAAALDKVETNQVTPAKVEKKFDYHQSNCEGSHELLPFPTEIEGVDAYAHIHSDDFLHTRNTENLTFWTSKGNGPQLMQISQGNGRLTVLTRQEIWENDNIFCYDSAYFLQFILNYQRPNQQKVWILYNEIMPSLLQLLWRNHQYLVWSSLILLLAWLWQQTLRMGPIYNEQQHTRRAFIEHLEAATRYRWQSGEHQQIIAELRQYVFNQMNHRHRGFNQQTMDEQTQLIAHHLAQSCSLSHEQIHKALFAPVSSTPESQIEPVQILQNIRKHL